MLRVDLSEPRIDLEGQASAYLLSEPRIDLEGQASAYLDEQVAKQVPEFLPPEVVLKVIRSSGADRRRIEIPGEKKFLWFRWGHSSKPIRVYREIARNEWKAVSPASIPVRVGLAISGLRGELDRLHKYLGLDKIVWVDFPPEAEVEVEPERGGYYDYTPPRVKITMK